MVQVLFLWLLLFHSPPVLAGFWQSGPPLEESFCPSSVLLQRSGRAHCWVQFKVGERRSVCVSRTLFRKSLRKGKKLCGVFHGKWRSFSPPYNTPSDLPKRTLSVFYATALDFEGKKNYWNGMEGLREKISLWVHPHDPSGIVRKLLLDEKTSDSSEGLLRAIGFVHVLSATGIHLYAVARVFHGSVFVFFQRIHLPLSSGMVFGLSFFLWLWAWGLAGFRPGMLRPWIIVVLRVGGRFLGFRWNRWAPLCLSLLFDGAIALYFLFSGLPDPAPGRIHYALAVGGGLLALDFSHSKPLSFRKTLNDHLALSVGSWVLPALYDVFAIRVIAWATPLLSLLTIPFLSLIFYPMSLLASFFLLLGEEAFARFLIANFSDLSHQVMSLLISGTLQSGTLWLISPWALFVAMGLFLLREKKLLFLSSLLFFRCLFSSLPLSPLIKQLDVGQGDAAFFQSVQTQGLIDVGSRWGLREERWLKIFALHGVTRLDWVLLTHWDEDHSGGLERLVHLIPIGRVVNSPVQWESERGRQWRFFLEERGIQISSWFSTGLFFEMNQGGKSSNQLMNGVLLQTSEWTYLNLGDANWNQEEAALRSLGGREFSGRKILKLSHHGSRFSTGERLLKGFLPAEAWVSSGLGNPYGHPSSEALRRVHQDTGTPRIRRTDQEGALSIQ